MNRNDPSLTRFVLLLVLLLFVLSASAAPGPMDFAEGMELHVDSEQPLQELLVPEALYAGVVHGSLADVRVFNSDGLAVPFAFCPSRTPQRAPGGRVRPPLFELRARDGKTITAGGVELELDEADGRRVRMLVPAGGKSADSGDAPRVQSWIVDARGLPEPVIALHLDWAAEEDASEARVDITASDDLRNWRRIVSGASLLYARGKAEPLRLNRIGLPPENYGYLRIAPHGEHALPRITGVELEYRAPVPEHEPVWIEAQQQNLEKEKRRTTDPEPAHVLLFDAGARAPVERVRVNLPASNLSLVVALDSRSGEEGLWRQRWQGEVYQLTGQNESAATPAIGRTTDRWWRLRVIKGMESLGEMKPGLSLGHIPARLQFLAQGEGPWLLAWGRGEVKPAAQACGELLSDLQDAERERMTGQVAAGPVRKLAGSSARRPLPDGISWSLVALWAVLVLGVVLLLMLSLSLLRKTG